MSKGAIIRCESASQIGKRIAMLRRERGWTQEELAERLGTTRSSVTNWEQGARLPDIDAWFNLAVEFGVSADYIAGTIKQRVLKGNSLTDQIDLDMLNELGRHMMFEFYHMLVNNSAFLANKREN